jgi:glutathione synthase/RimK-type ligase-like ATP-grasp enzyme
MVFYVKSIRKLISNRRRITMRDAILVLTNSEDGEHSQSVISKLLENGERVFRFDSDRFSAGETTIAFSPDSDESLTIDDGRRSLQRRDVKSIWYRRPNRFNLSIHDSVQREYAEKELRFFLDGAWSLFERDEHVYFLSKPSSIEKARRKLLQLELAKHYGVRIPRTVITNNPQEVLAFNDSCPSGIVFKAINHECLDYGETSYNIPTTLMTAEHLKRIDLIKKAPGIFQELIPKECELRVTVVGKRIFPVKIDSQKNPLTIVDWRNPLCIDKLSYTMTTLDRKTETFCHEMLLMLDLQFGAFDFIVDTKGDIYFLEVNPNGQWYWLENMAGALISDAIVDILTNGTERR